MSELVRVALPKGRLGDKVYNLFEKIGYPCKEIKEENRKLVFVSDDKEVSFFLVKPSDVAVYVERGAADIGVVGKDVLLETESDVYELLDLGFGKCRFAVAGRADFRYDNSKVLRVATKYPNVATRYFEGINQNIDIIKLNGSVEIAPLLGMSDVIVDIVETGGTLRENNLAVLEDVVDISARLIANKKSYKFMNEKLMRIVEKIEKEIRGE